MSPVLALIGVSAFAGLALALLRLHCIALVFAGVVLVIAAAVVLPICGFGFPAEIATIVACLTANQGAYLVGASLIVFIEDRRQSVPRTAMQSQPEQRGRRALAAQRGTAASPFAQQAEHDRRAVGGAS